MEQPERIAAIGDQVYYYEVVLNNAGERSMKVYPATVMEFPTDSSKPGEVTLKVERNPMYRAGYRDVPTHGHWSWRTDLHRAVSQLDKEAAEAAPQETEVAIPEVEIEKVEAKPVDPTKEPRLQKSGKK